MIDKALVVVASRGRSARFKDCVEAWRQNSSQSDLLVCLDTNDPDLENYEHYQDVFYDIDGRLMLSPKTNRGIKKYPDYKYYFSMGDDHLCRTKDWDKILIKKIEDNGGWGISYGDDLLQSQNIPTACMMSANIVNTLGWMALPTCQHMYIDNVWLDLGKGIDKLFYCPDVTVEHLHHSAGKSVKDTTYEESNNNTVLNKDFKAYQKWLTQDKGKDVDKILKAMFL